MKRVLDAAVVGLAAIAFLAALIPYCPCPEMRSTKAAEHECCAPVAGLRAAPSECCAHHSDATATATADAPKAFSPVALPAATVAVVATLAMQAPALPSALGSSFSPSPPLILRV